MSRIVDMAPWSLRTAIVTLDTENYEKIDIFVYDLKISYKTFNLLDQCLGIALQTSFFDIFGKKNLKKTFWYLIKRLTQ